MAKSSGIRIQTLTTEQSHRYPWFYIDIEYYLAQCIENGVMPPFSDARTCISHYLSRGSRQGFSPNPLFDETYYRQLYPEVALGIEAGKWNSGFVHYATVGAYEDYSPSWFFDGTFYRNTNPDLTENALTHGGFGCSYDHFLLVGIGERRPAHWTVKALLDFTAKNAFPAKIEDLLAILSDGPQLVSILKPAFDFEWMREKYAWDNTVRPTRFMRHYLSDVRTRHLSPSPFFNESFYLEAEPEIGAAVAQGLFYCGYEHFVLHGVREWRSPFPGFDPRYYFNINMRQEATQAEESLTPVAHFLRNYGKRHLPISPPLAAMNIPEESGKAIYERRCRINAVQFGSLDLAIGDSGPSISLIIIVRNNYEQTANCIISAVRNSSVPLEIIVFDNGSKDSTQRLSEINSGVRYIRSESNIGFTVAVNKAAEVARGRVLLLLNNDLEVAPRAIDLALQTLDCDATVGAVGAKIIRMHGLLQEAGCIVWRDGSSLGFGRDQDPLDGQANFVRDVDFCSGCFLAVRRADWDALRGFDEAYAPAYYEETDLCLRIQESGKRIVYDPRIVVWHYEYGSSSIREEPLTLMRRNQRYFERKHRAYLSKCFPPALANVERARLRHAKPGRTLFVEDLVPDPLSGMGFVRSAQIAEVLAECSGMLSILGLHSNSWPTELPKDEKGRQVELLTNVNASNITEFLRDRVGIYDTLWLSRTHNLNLLRKWQAACPEFFAQLHIVLDTEAISAAREHNYAEIASLQSDLGKRVASELEHLEGINHICVVNELDRDLVTRELERRDLPTPISQLGHSLEVSPALPSFEETTDIVIAGSFSHFDGPNADGLLWFDREVRPHVKSLPGLRFVIAGNKAAQFTRNVGLRHDWVVNDSPSSMQSVYNTARLMVAPTRFAAGVPMKVHEAASYGVPVVMTTLLALQLGWQNEAVAMVPVNGEMMAGLIDSLCSDATAWRNCQQLQTALIRRDCDPVKFDTTIRSIVARPSGDSGALRSNVF